MSLGYRVTRLRWPLPALIAWGLAAALYGTLDALIGSTSAAVMSSALPIVLIPWVKGWWRRTLMALGFPLALLTSGAYAFLPGWAWLLLLALLLLVYPLGAWRDAPLFPTPRGALAGLAGAAPLAPGALVLDAGCGLGDGLIALRLAYPDARIEGLERSIPLRLLCGLRCRWAKVRGGDMWRASWGGYALVYLFQRPESMERAWRKACAEMVVGSWLVSLEFPLKVRGVVVTARLDAAGGRPVWIYRIPRRPRGQG